MEDIMTRIAEALEQVEAIQTNNDEQIKQYQQLRTELAQDIKKALSERPVIKNQIDPKALANELIPSLVGKLPDPSAIRDAGKEIIEGIEAERKKIPSSIRMKGDFYGMASKNAFMAYMGSLVGVIIICLGICLYYRHQADELTVKEIANELAAERNYYLTQINRYKDNNPTYANLFPAFDDTKLQEALDKHAQEKRAAQPQ